MTLERARVYVRDKEFDPWEEIGYATDVEMTQTNMVPTSLIDDRGRRMASPSHNGYDIDIKLTGWNTPAPIFTPPPTSPIFRQPETDVEDMALLLAVLVRMMGSSVTISPSDLVAAQRCELTNYRMQEPFALVLTVKEPGE